MPTFDLNMIFTFLMWIAGSIVTIGGATTILKKWSDEFKNRKKSKMQD